MNEGVKLDNNLLHLKVLFLFQNYLTKNKIKIIIIIKKMLELTSDIFMCMRSIMSENWRAKTSFQSGNGIQWTVQLIHQLSQSIEAVENSSKLLKDQIFKLIVICLRTLSVAITENKENQRFEYFFLFSFLFLQMS